MKVNIYNAKERYTYFEKNNDIVYFLKDETCNNKIQELNDKRKFSIGYERDYKKKIHKHIILKKKKK